MPEQPTNDPVPATAGAIKPRTISPQARTVLEKLAAPEAITIMEEMMRAADNNNNNNNNGGGGGSGCAAVGGGLSREQLVQRLNTVSDDRLHAILRQQGII